MTLAEQLREYNDWRRGGDFSQPNPRELGVLIDKSADRLEQAEKVIAELEKAAEYIEINAEECLDWDDSISMFVPIGAYHKLMEALASAKSWKEKT